MKPVKMKNHQERPLEKLKSSSDNKKIILKAGLSVVIVYILTVAIVMPNGTSFLGRKLSPIILDFANQFGFSVNWNFFAPDPAHTMYISYVVNFTDDSKESIQGYIPPEKEKIVVDASERRFLYAMRFMIVDDRRLKKILGPFLCRKFTGASSVYIRSVLEPILNLDASIHGFENKLESTIMEHTHDCLKEPDEDDL